MIKLRLYTSICLCLPLQDASSQSQIIDTLTKGLERLSVSFPWLAGQVISEVVAEGNSGLPRIIPLDKTSRLIVKDLTHDAAVSSMDALRKANFPSSMLDGEVFTPLKGLPTSIAGDPAPVFFIQANFINGGLLLNFAGEHNTMDEQGLGQVIRIFSKA
jgi:trichothecene 3-O-acetyltransferase